MTFNHSSPGGVFPPHSPSRNLAFAAAAAAAAAAVSMSREAHRARCRALARRLEDAAATPVQYMKLKAHAHAYQTHDDDADGYACAAFVACLFATLATCGERFDLIAEVVATTPGVGKRERLAARVEAATRDVVARCGAPARTMAQPHKNYKVERLNDGLVCLRKFLTVEAQEWLAKSAFEVGESDAASAEAGKGFFAKTAADEGALKLNQGTRGRVIKAVDDFPGETLKELCGEAVRVARDADASLPSGFNPTTVLVNFYKDGAEFKWHKDSEDPKLIASKTGQPIVSFSVGLSADFGYKYSFDDPEHKTVRLNSGDVLLFGGPSRMIVHSVLNVHPGSMPGNMRGKMLNGRLNVTVRDIGTGVIDTSQFPAYRVSYDGVQAEGNV